MKALITWGDLRALQFNARKELPDARQMNVNSEAVEGRPETLPQLSQTRVKIQAPRVEGMPSGSHLDSRFRGQCRTPVRALSTRYFAMANQQQHN
jgi:hypothetical protein